MHFQILEVHHEDLLFKPNFLFEQNELTKKTPPPKTTNPAVMIFVQDRHDQQHKLCSTQFQAGPSLETLLHEYQTTITRASRQNYICTTIRWSSSKTTTKLRKEPYKIESCTDTECASRSELKNQRILTTCEIRASRGHEPWEQCSGRRTQFSSGAPCQRRW